jgi:hypothetical protein
MGVDAVALQPGDQAFAGGDVAAGDDQLDSLAPEGLGGSPTDAGSGARNQHDFVVETIHGLLLVVAGSPAVRED